MSKYYENINKEIKKYFNVLANEFPDYMEFYS